MGSCPLGGKVSAGERVITRDTGDGGVSHRSERLISRIGACKVF